MHYQPTNCYLYLKFLRILSIQYQCALLYSYFTISQGLFVINLDSAQTNALTTIHQGQYLC